MWFVPPWFKYAAPNKTTSDAAVRQLISWGTAFWFKMLCDLKAYCEFNSLLNGEWFIKIDASEFDRIIHHQGLRIPASVKADKPSRPEFMACLKPSTTTTSKSNTDLGGKVVHKIAQIMPR